MTPLRAAASIAAALALWMCTGCAVNAQTPPSAAEAAAYGGLHAAAWRGDVAAIERLASDKSARTRGARRQRPHAAARGHVRASRRRGARAGCEAGANPAALDNDRYDAVTIAAVADDEATLAVLLELGASAKLTTSRYDGTALIAAAHLGHDGVVRQLIAAGAPLDHVNNLHWTAPSKPWCSATAAPRHQATLRALIDAGANIRLTDREGRTPLQLARSRGYAAMVALLERTPR